MPQYVPIPARKHRYRQFAAKYVKNGCNGLQTALECGFTDNPNSAGVIASRLLRYVYVQNEIEKHMAKAKITADEVIEELSDIAKSKVDNYSESAKLKALELSGKFHKLFTDRTETLDLTQHSALESSLLKSINQAAKAENIEQNQAAVALFNALKDDPQFAQVESWPAEFRGIIQQSQQNEQVMDGGDQ